MSESSRRSNGELSIPYIPPLAVVKRKRWWRLGDLLVTDNDDSTDNSYRWLRPKMLVLLRTSSYWMVDFCEASFIPSSCHEWHNDDIDGTSKVATTMIAIYSNPRFLFDWLPPLKWLRLSTSFSREKERRKPRKQTIIGRNRIRSRVSIGALCWVGQALSVNSTLVKDNDSK